MIVSLVVIFLILFIGFQFSKKYQQNKDSFEVRKRYIKIISFILILQSGLRHVAVGDDTYVYYSYFIEIQEKSWLDIYQNFINVYKFDEGKDPGYLLFEKLISLISSEYQILLFVIALLFFVAFGNFILKNTNRLQDAVLGFVIYSVLFYSFFSITGHRQTIATAASLLAFEYIKKRKIFPFLILILTASTIHKSVLLFLPFYFIAHIKNTKYFNWTILLSFPIFMINRNSISQYFKLLAGYEEYGINEAAGTFTFTLLFLVISITALVRTKIILRQHPNAQFAFNAFALALLFIPLTWVNPSAMRVVQYFSIFMLILVPDIINSFDTYSKKIARDIRFFTVLVLIALMIKSRWNSPSYGFFWENMMLNSNY